MNGVKHEIKGDLLILTVDISKVAIDAAPPSSSGKTFLVASTGGPLAISSSHCKELKFALNVMAKK